MTRLAYSILVLRRAEKELAALPQPVRVQLLDSIRALADEPRPTGSAKLSGREGWRIRIGRYRVLYEIDDAQQTLTVLHVGHRKDVYRQ